MIKSSCFRFLAVCLLLCIISCEKITNTNVQNLPTEITFLSPQENDITSPSTPLQIHVIANDNDSVIDKLELYLNDVLISTSLSNEIILNYNFTELELGKTILLVKAFDNMDRIDSLKTSIYVESNHAMSLSKNNVFCYDIQTSWNSEPTESYQIIKEIINETYDDSLRSSEIMVTYIYWDGSTNIFYENLSSDTTAVYTDNQDTLYDLTWNSGSNNVVETGDLIIFGRNKEYIRTRIDSQFGEMWSFRIDTYSKTFGLTNEHSCFFDGSNYLEEEKNLIGAIIDEKQYGEIVE